MIRRTAVLIGICRSESVMPFECVNCQFHRHASTSISTALVGGVTTRT